MEKTEMTPFPKDFYIYQHKNPEYLMFLEESKVKSYFRKQYHVKLIETFKEKNIHLILIPNLSHRETYQCLSVPYNRYMLPDRIQTLLEKQGRNVHYDDLQYPSFGKLYILFDVNNFENENIIKYYTIDRYFFQMKSYVHNFLIFLAQSFGADKIKWSLITKNSSHESSEASVSAGSHGVTNETRGSFGNDTEKRMSSDLELTYDNNGSEIFFETTTNELPWCVKIQKIINDSSVPYDVIKYWRNDKVMEKFLKNNRYFRYEFYKNNEFLVDFIRKRQNGMNSINHEIVFYDNHRTIFNYYNSLGVTHLASIGLSFSQEQSASTFNTTLYRVTFYETSKLEIKTLQTSIIEEKSISQLKGDNETTIGKIREKQSKWENDNEKAMKYKYKYYNFMKKLQIRLFTFDEAKVQHQADVKQKLEKYRKEEAERTAEMLSQNHMESLKRSSGGLGCGCGGAESNVYNPIDHEPYHGIDYGDPHKTFIEGNKHNERQIDRIRNEVNVKYNMYVILQKYNRYFQIQENQLRERIGGIGNPEFSLLENDSECGDGTESEEEVRQTIQRNIERRENAKIKQQKITFMKDLLRCFYTLIEQNNIDDEEDDDKNDDIRSFKMDTYVEKTSDEYIHMMVEHIMNSIDIGKAMDEYLSDIRRLTRDIEPPSSSCKASGKKLDVFMECSFICESQYYESLSEGKTKDAIGDILSKMKDYDKYSMRQRDAAREKLESETSDVDFIRVSSKPDAGNYASCDGYYMRDENSKVNGIAVFINEYKHRFIGRAGDTWIITGTQWLDGIIEESVKTPGFSFGGFHSSTNTSNSIITATWKDYEIFVTSAEEVVKIYKDICPSMSDKALALSSSDEETSDSSGTQEKSDDANNLEDQMQQERGSNDSDLDKNNVGMAIDSFKQQGEDPENIILTEEPQEEKQEQGE
jgi:hypothetical protein